MKVAVPADIATKFDRECGLILSNISVSYYGRNAPQITLVELPHTAPFWIILEYDVKPKLAYERSQRHWDYMIEFGLFTNQAYQPLEYVNILVSDIERKLARELLGAVI